MNDTEKFKALLGHNHEWPCDYLFKFIILAAREDEILNLLGTTEVKRNFSKNGKYVTISAHLRMESPEEVVKVFEKAKKIEGIIGL